MATRAGNVVARGRQEAPETVEPTGGSTARGAAGTLRCDLRQAKRPTQGRREEPRWGLA